MSEHTENDAGRYRCPTCGATTPVTKARCLRKHKRQESGHWHMVPCEGSGTRVRHEFTEDVDDYSMCVCGVPALTHDSVYPPGSSEVSR